MALSLDGVTVDYGSFRAVRDVSLSIPDGEVFGLLGPSGSGKSTLLRAIAGVESGVSGSMRWDGTDLAAVPVHRRGFGLVFQEGQLFQHHDVAGNIGFGLRMHGYGKHERAERVAELLELIGLGGYQRRKVSELSGGEERRVALARALAVRPSLLLLDEPLSGLDANLREQLAIDLSGMLREAGITTMLVTHDQEEAFTLSDRVAMLDEGTIRQAGPVREVWFSPADGRVAEFLGVTSVLEATGRDGVADCALGELTVPEAPEGGFRLGLRPNALRAAESGIAGEVVSVVRRTDHARLSVRPHGVEFRVDAVASMMTGLRAGDKVFLAVDPDGLAIVGRSRVRAP